MDLEYRNDIRKIGTICSTCIIYSFLLEKILKIDIKTKSVLNTISLYFERRMVRILLLGIIQGFPFVLIYTALTLWLRDNEFSRTQVAFLSLIGIVYGFNWIWSPLVDLIKLPLITKIIGHRKSWIVFMQFIILSCLIIWGLHDPKDNIWIIGLAGLIIAIASSTQDIVTDALRIEQIKKNESGSMSAGAGVMVIGWFTGYKIGGIITLFLAEYLEGLGIQNFWQITFLFLTIFILICNISLMFIPEAKPINLQMGQKKTLLGPFVSFFKSRGIKIGIYIIIFLFLFKIGEAFLGRMSIIFYDDIGFSKKDIALYSKGYGYIVTIIFTILGSFFAIRSGLIKGMIIAGLLMASTNLLFSVLAWYGKSDLLFASAVILDEITSAISTVIFVAFVSVLVDRTYTATHYALMASIATLGKNVFSSFSGYVVDNLEFLNTSANSHNDWVVFFIITTIMVFPSLGFLWMIKDKLNINNE